jgi:biopolymer transport protein ExbB/TolQ
MTDGNLGTATNQLVLAAITVAGFIINGLIAWNNRRQDRLDRADERAEKERQRQWDLEDRERARRELAEKVETQQGAVLQAVAENTEMNRVAIQEANNMNQKLAEQRELMNSMTANLHAVYERRVSNYKQRATDRPPTEIAVDTNAVVHETHEKVQAIEKKLDG